MADFSDIAFDGPAWGDQQQSVNRPNKSVALFNNNAVSGTILRVKIRVENWNGAEWNGLGENSELDCGAFEIDGVDFLGPPNMVSIKAVSTPVSSSMRREMKTRAWEDVTLRQIAQDIADDAGFDMMYEVDTDVQLDRIEQLEMSDMAFLLGLARQYGIAVKVTNNKVVLFKELSFEARPVVETFDMGEVGGRLINYRFSQDTSDTVKKAINKYKDPKSGKLVKAEFEPPNPPATEQIALINMRPGDLRGDNYREGIDTASGESGGTFTTNFAEFSDIMVDFRNVRADVTDNAMMQAQAVARAKNKMEWTCDLEMVGNVSMVSGATIQLNGFGVYSGKYLIMEATHKVGGSYVTSVKAHRVIGY